MALLNTDQVTPMAAVKTNGKGAISHYINAYVVDGEGKQLKIGAVPIWDDAKSDYNQRTLLAAIEGGLDPSSLDIVISVNANVPSTKVGDSSGWATRT